MYNYNYDELKYYGVLGMKWGVHRAKVNAAKASATKSTSKQLSKEIKELKGYEENAKKKLAMEVTRFRLSLEINS